jgi:hypothetical protein
MSQAAAPRFSLRGSAEGMRARASTTPGRLRTRSVIVVIATGLLWLAGGTALASATATIDNIGHHAGPAIIDAQKIHEALADADRSAANAFLSGDAEGAASRQRYQRDITTATQQLERAAEYNHAGGEASKDLQLVIARVTEYAGLVETAKANNRQGFPVGAAYLREASRLMHRPRDGILDSVDALADLNSQSMVHGNFSLWYTAAQLAVFVVFDIGLFAVLFSTQAFLRQRFRRRRNYRLLAATALLALLTAGMGLQTLSTYRNLTVAEQDAFTHLRGVWQARSLAVDANGNESLSLIARGNGGPFDAAFSAETGQLVDRRLSDGLVEEAGRGHVRFGGLLADQIVNARFPGERDAAMRALRAYQRFMEVDAAVRARAGSDHDGAVALALGSGPGQLGGPFADMDAALADAIEIDQRQFDAAIDAARPGVALDLGMSFCSLAILLLALWGLQPRIAEYRS